MDMHGAGVAAFVITEGGGNAEVTRLCRSTPVRVDGAVGMAEVAGTTEAATAGVVAAVEADGAGAPVSVRAVAVDRAASEAVVRVRAAGSSVRVVKADSAEATQATPPAAWVPVEDKPESAA